jgi:glutamyl-tRNA synthetase
MGRGADGTVSKLSKRHGAVSFAALLDDGYLAEAIINYIALLGWCPKGTENEFFTLEEMIRVFTVDGINKSSAVFDYEKLLWFNGEYIRRMSAEDFKKAALPFLGEHSLSDEKLDKVLSLVQPRIEKLSQIREKIGFFLALPDYDAEALFPNKKNKVTLENAKGLLLAARDALISVSDFTNDTLFAALGAKAEELSVKSGAILWCVRIAVSGQGVTPGGATEILEVLGKEEALSRIDTALQKLPA